MRVNTARELSRELIRCRKLPTTSALRADITLGEIALQSRDGLGMLRSLRELKNYGKN